MLQEAEESCRDINANSAQNPQPFSTYSTTQSINTSISAI